VRSKNFDEAYNNNDAAALAALFTEDEVFVTPQGPIYSSRPGRRSYTGQGLLVRDFCS